MHTGYMYQLCIYKGNIAFNCTKNCQPSKTQLENGTPPQNPIGKPFTRPYKNTAHMFPVNASL